jgi:hypothetical protein
MDEDAQFSALLCEYVLLADALRVVKEKVAEEVLKRYPSVEEYDKVHRDMKALLRNALNPADQQFLLDTDSGVGTAGAEDKKRRKTLIHRINRWFNEIRIAVYQSTEVTSTGVGLATADYPIAGKSMYIAYYSDDEDYSETDNSDEDREAGGFDIVPVHVQVAETLEVASPADSPALVESKVKRKSAKKPQRRSPKSPSSSVESKASTESFETLNDIDDFDEFVDQVINFAFSKFNQKIDIVICDDEDEDADDGDEKVTAPVKPLVDLQLRDAPTAGNDASVNSVDLQLLELFDDVDPSVNPPADLQMPDVPVHSLTVATLERRANQLWN